MRISDWSSDVCSSDLRRPDPQRRRSRRSLIDLQEPTPANWRRPLARIQRDSLNEEDHFSRREHQVRHPAPSRDVHRFPLACPLVFQLAPGRLPRSEEHTSELQSLMRISYAVFCLKKKIMLYFNNTVVLLLFTLFSYFCVFVVLYFLFF